MDMCRYFICKSTDIGQKWPSCELIRSKKCIIGCPKHLQQSRTTPFGGCLKLDRSPKLNLFGVLLEEPSTLTQAQLICHQYVLNIPFKHLWPAHGPSQFWGIAQRRPGSPTLAAGFSRTSPVPRQSVVPLGANFGGWETIKTNEIQPNLEIRPTKMQVTMNSHVFLAFFETKIEIGQNL